MTRFERDDSIVIRPVAPGDERSLDALMSSLDDRSRYRRWFTGAADVHRAAEWAAHPDEAKAYGLVALAPRAGLVGHAAMVDMGDGRAEVAFEVAAPWRHHGIAGRLLDELHREAKRRGYKALVAEVLPENTDMLAVLHEHGVCEEHRDGGVLELQVAVGIGTPQTVG